MGEIKNTFLFSIFFLALLIGSSQVSSQIDSNLIGVTNGESFDLQISRATGDFVSQYTEGEVLTITIIDANPNIDNQIEVEVSNSGETKVLSQAVQMDQFGEYVIFTDWVYWGLNAHDSTLQPYEQNSDLTMEAASSSSGGFSNTFDIDANIKLLTGTIDLKLSYIISTGIIADYYISNNYTDNLGNTFFGELQLVNNDIPRPDTTMIGVNQGDIFEFEIVEFTQPDIPTTDNQDDYEFSVPQVGDRVTVEVLSTLLNENNEIQTKTIGFDGEITNDPIPLDEFGSPIIFTDWDYWEQAAATSNRIFGGNPYGENQQSMVTNDANTFKVSSSFSDASESYENSFSSTVSYDKSTGVLNFVEYHTSLKDLQSGETQKFDVKLQRVGFSEDGSGLLESLPGFEGLFLGFTLLFVVVPITKQIRKTQL